MARPHLFISYRRSDSIDAVRGLYFQLRLRFGSSNVFMDVSAIPSGSVWPERLRRHLDKATAVLVVIGPDWLRVADEYGRRRLDSSADWVRLEIEHALADERKAVIPLLVRGLRDMPPAQALPASLARLAERQHLVVDDASWESDVDALAKTLEREYGFREADAAVMKPLPQKVHQPAMTEEQLDLALQALPGWELVETSSPRDYPHTRHELRRGYRFSKFKEAIGFLQLLVEPLNRLQHHPRIENQWRTVIIYFTTWDIGNRITQLDIDAATVVDDLYRAQQQSKV